eukprot:CAMPEP_0197862238 /NCGR_PEP_ID=MMETSP1438-20131217/38880_1 /TAXON_ID=1461541 /ORGANISM="Pterosperma sp., Strain CCMP1384" /LENGTH=68 /DNA_ID=CAMNT_0043479739 /DNA_START=44 /DNA_END=250 /DNA_ORIENTATION=+
MSNESHAMDNNTNTIEITLQCLSFPNSVIWMFSSKRPIPRVTICKSKFSYLDLHFYSYLYESGPAMTH